MNKKLNVLLSAFACEPNKGSEPGVGWNWVINLAPKVNALHVLVCGSEHKEKIEDYLKNNNLDNVKFYYVDYGKKMSKYKWKIPYFIFIYYKLWQKEALKISKKIIANNDIDIIHHVTYNEYRTIGKLFKLDKPFIWGPIGGGQMYNPILRQAYFKPIDVYKDLIRNYINLSIANSKQLYYKSKNISKILVSDRATAELLSGKVKFEMMLETAYNGELIPKDYKIESNEPIKIMWAGVLIPRKGLKWVLDALSESEFENYQLTIVGEGKEKEICEKYVIDKNISNKVKFIGKIPYDNMKNLYRESDLFVFSSLRDTSGNVVLEAMANGLPVIALNHNGVADMLDDKSGIKIEINSYEQIKDDFIKALKEFDNDRLKIKEFGINAQNRIKENYRWDIKVSKMLEYYKEAINSES